ALQLNFTWSHNEIQQFTQDTMNLIGKVPPGFPTAIAGASLLLKPVTGLAFSLAGKYVGEIFGDLQNSDRFRNDPYTVLDGYISYRENNILGMQYVELKVQVSN